MAKANHIVFIFFLLLQGCSDSDSNVALVDRSGESTLKNGSAFSVGNVFFLEDDPRFIDYQSLYYDVSDIIKSESDYVGHDEIFRIRETHPTPYTKSYERLDEFVEFAEREGYRIHGHNLLFYSDIGADSWISGFRKNGTWTQEQWLVWFEQYVKDKVGRYKGRVASWDVLNEPLARVLLDDPDARNIAQRRAADLDQRATPQRHPHDDRTARLFGGRGDVIARRSGAGHVQPRTRKHAC